MKSLNIKKLVAVGAGLALVAASVSGAAIVKSDIIDDAAKSVKVNGIVYGAKALPSDKDAADLLAGTIAELAVTKTAGATTYPLVCPTSGAEGFTGDSKKFDTTALGTAITSQAVTYTNLDSLIYESSLSYKVGGTTDDASAKETLTFTVTPSYDTSNDVQRLNAEVAADGLQYSVDFGTGIDFNLDDGFTGSTWTDAGAADKVEIPFLGKTYVVHKVTLSGGNIQQLELFEKNAIKVFTKGDKIEGLKGKDGKNYYVLIKAVTSTPEVVLALYDAATGAVVADYENEQLAEGDDFAEDVLLSKVQVTSIDNWGTADVPEWHIEAAVGAEAVTVYSGKGYPYDSTKTTNSEYDFDASITGTAGLLTLVTLSNTSRYDFRNEDGMETGDVVKFPGDLAALQFVGLQLPEFEGATNPKEVTEAVIGTDVTEGEGKGLTYVDSSETKHEIPFYYSFDLDDVTASDDSEMTGWTNAYYVDSFEFDGRTYSLKVAWESDENASVWLYEGSYSASATSEQDIEAVDLNVSGSNSTLWDVDQSPLLIPNSEDANVEYAIALDTSEEKLWLLLDAQAIVGKDYNVNVVGTDINGESSAFTDVDAGATFYAPSADEDFKTMVENTVDFNSTYTHDDFDDDYSALFKATVTYSTATVNVVIDTETGEAVEYGASTNTSNSIPGPGYQAKLDSSSTLKIEDGETNGLEMFYDTYGTKVSLDDGAIVAVVPEEQAKTEFKVLGKGEAVATTTCDEADKVQDTAHPVAGADVLAPYAGAYPVVRADAAAATGKYIVVGGYLVNALWPEALKAGLTKAGEKVAETLDGSVYIAGWTAADTTEAVAEVVKILEGSSQGEQ